MKNKKYYDDLHNEQTSFRYLIVGSDFHNNYFIGRSHTLKNAFRIYDKNRCTTCCCGGPNIIDLSVIEDNRVHYDYWIEDKYGNYLKRYNLYC